MPKTNDKPLTDLQHGYLMKLTDPHARFEYEGKTPGVCFNITDESTTLIDRSIRPDIYVVPGSHVFKQLIDGGFIVLSDDRPYVMVSAYETGKIPRDLIRCAHTYFDYRDDPNISPMLGSIDANTRWRYDRDLLVKAPNMLLLALAEKYVREMSRMIHTTASDLSKPVMGLDDIPLSHRVIWIGAILADDKESVLQPENPMFDPSLLKMLDDAAKNPLVSQLRTDNFGDACVAYLPSVEHVCFYIDKNNAHAPVLERLHRLYRQVKVWYNASRDHTICEYDPFNYDDANSNAWSIVNWCANNSIGQYPYAKIREAQSLAEAQNDYLYNGPISL